MSSEYGPIAHSIGSATFAARDYWNGLAVLHDAAATTGALDLGFVPGEGGLDTGKIVDAADLHGASVIADEVEDTSSLAVLWQCGVKLISGAFLKESSQVIAQ